MMLAKLNYVPGIFCVAFVLAVSASAQTTTQRQPSNPTRPFVVLPAQSLSDLERKLQSDNKVEEAMRWSESRSPEAFRNGAGRPKANRFV